MTVKPDTKDSAISFEELKKLDAYFDEQLNKKGPKNLEGSVVSRFNLKKLLLRLFAALFFMVLPFFLLIRSSTYLYLGYGFNGWAALAGGIGLTVVLLLLYALAASYYVRGSIKIGKYLSRAVIALVVVYCGYSLFYFSSMNVKSEKIRNYYRSLHPILRVTLTTATLADTQLIITDSQRTPADYVAMGLNPLRESMHYLQDDGYVHAVDIRTIGRVEWVNVAMQYSLELLGFNTLRHTGTADHLHVALPN